jgi:hypothetical protein
LTIIELLSRPLFFFRTHDDLDFTVKAKSKLIQEELARRDQDGNVDADDTTITWTLL